MQAPCAAGTSRTSKIGSLGLIRRQCRSGTIGRVRRGLDAAGGGRRDRAQEIVVDGQPMPRRAYREVAVDESRFPRAGRVRAPDGASSGYTVAVPKAGASEITHCGQTVDLDASRAAVARPEDETDMCCGDGFACYFVRIKTEIVMDALEHLLGHPVSRPLDLGPSFDLRTPAGRAWSGMVRRLASSPLLDDPVRAAPLKETLTVRLLLAVDHRYRDELDGSVRSWAPGPVRRMVDAIEERPRHPFTLAELSDIAGVGTRALGLGCRRHLDISPAERLNATRLAAAHRELEASDAGRTTATAVASGWGFTDAGRFAAEYAHQYREPPWLTLRGPAYA
ncbi:AraC-like ligand-binding domain-containing protein [Pseudonocardia dioxanivorans]|uniref:AraC-like ligand-binding domain-containing protein n=1 Tax=Pseudonocardia dioxanivorans TaxID=240495 RepID=UPI00117C70FF|nr:helix-turn-helix domain-containing protein [Pseudonocardia dioxanivorans]